MWVSGTLVLLPLGKATNHTEGPGFKSQLISIQLLANAYPGRQPVMTQVHWSLPLMWETWMGFTLLASAWPSPSCYGHLGE